MCDDSTFCPIVKNNLPYDLIKWIVHPSINRSNLSIKSASHSVALMECFNLIHYR